MLPVSAAQAQVVGGPLAEPALAVGFGAFTLATTLNIFGAEIFNAALLTAQWDPELVAGAAPGAAAFLGILVVHEVGHRLAAAARGVQLAPPLFIPAGLGLLGSFGAITRITSFVPDRASLAAVAAAGPLASSAAALAVMVAGAAATAGGAGGVELDVASFRWAAGWGRQGGRAAPGGVLPLVLPATCGAAAVPPARHPQAACSLPCPSPQHNEQGVSAGGRHGRLFLRRGRPLFRRRGRRLAAVCVRRPACLL